MRAFYIGLEVAAILGFVALVFREDMKSAIVTEKIVAESRKPITYTITQDSPGLDFYEKRGYEKAPLPITSPLEKKDRK